LATVLAKTGEPAAPTKSDRANPKPTLALRAWETETAKQAGVREESDWSIGNCLLINILPLRIARQLIRSPYPEANVTN
jgi:hypothetical protein